MLDIAELANGFVAHPYWNRMVLMLRNTEREEMETLLDPTQADRHALSRASIANLRKLLAMPYIDIAQGDKAVEAVDKHRERFGETDWRTAQRGATDNRDA